MAKSSKTSPQEKSGGLLARVLRLATDELYGRFSRRQRIPEILRLLRAIRNQFPGEHLIIIWDKLELSHLKPHCHGHGRRTGLQRDVQPTGKTAGSNTREWAGDLIAGT